MQQDIRTNINSISSKKGKVIWMADTYKETKTFEFSNCTVRVHIPDLTEDERTARQKKLYEAAERFMKSVLKGSEQK